MSYRGFKMHPFAWPEVDRHVEAVLAIGKAVGGTMDMMLDPYCLYETFADALRVRASYWSSNAIRATTGEGSDSMDFFVAS